MAFCMPFVPMPPSLSCLIFYFIFLVSTDYVSVTGARACEAQGWAVSDKVTSLSASGGRLTTAKAHVYPGHPTTITLSNV